jgi:hypothetical protein
VPAATPPATYNHGDTITVALKNSVSLKVKLQHVDMAAGNFKGEVLESEDGEVRPGDLVSFNYRWNGK